MEIINKMLFYLVFISSVLFLITWFFLVPLEPKQQDTPDQYLLNISRDGNCRIQTRMYLQLKYLLEEKERRYSDIERTNERHMHSFPCQGQGERRCFAFPFFFLFFMWKKSLAKIFSSLMIQIIAPMVLRPFKSLLPRMKGSKLASCATKRGQQPVESQ